MALPRILIPIPTSFDESYNAQSWPEYAAAVNAAGGEAVQVPLSSSDKELETLANGAQGILLPGSGADVDPARYGHDKDPACADADRLREQTDIALIEAAERWNKPMLCICFGTQSLNVRHGGTLIQDLQPVPVNHRAGRAVQAAHSVVLPTDSRLGRILASTGDATEDDGLARVPVNSSHHQAIASVGSGLRVVARCPTDGVIEAIEGTDLDRWLIALQWHPERTIGTSAGSRMIFQDFIAAATA